MFVINQVFMCVCVHVSYSLPQLFVRVELLQHSKSLHSRPLSSRTAQQRPGLRLAESWEISVFGVDSVGYVVQQICILVFVV